MTLVRGARRIAVASGAAVALSIGLTKNVTEQPLEGSAHNIDALRDALLLWTEKSVDVGQATISVCGTLKDTALAVFQSGSSPPTSLTQSFVGRVKDWSEHPVKSKTLVVVGGGILLDWLLRKACSLPSPDQLAAESAICNLLSNDVTAAALLKLEGAIPRLLHMTARSEDSERIAQCLEKAADMVTFPANASLDDLREGILLMNGADGLPTRSAAAKCLARWAGSSVLNCGKIASMQGGPALAKCLASAGPSSASAALTMHVMEAMAILARDCPLRSLLEMDAWLQQLLFLAADASARGSYMLVTRALDCFATCLAQSEGLEVSLQDSNAWPLLQQLATCPDLDVRRALILAVAAMSHHHLPDQQRAFWAGLLLEWLCGNRGAGQLPLGDATHAVIALDALAASPGRTGLAVASSWLGELLVALSRNVKTYSSIRLGGRDMIEEVTQDHVAVGPAFARSVAFELRGAYEQQPPWQDPPIDMDHALAPSAATRRPELLSVQDANLADAKLSRTLKVLCALISSDDAKQRWLQSAGIVSLLQRLTLNADMDVDMEHDTQAGRSTMSLATQRQCARLLAMVAASGSPQEMSRNRAWLKWLHKSALSSDCKLSSHARRALLHLESAKAFRPTINQTVDISSMLLVSEGRMHEAEQEGLAARRLVIKDGVHLFDPQAAHHTVLAREGNDSCSEGAPEIDLVFVHGIRGGAFASWRAGRSTGGSPSDDLLHTLCWPSEWLSQDVPQARLLSLEYAAPASGWEGESLPLRGTVGQLMDKLAAAGVGQRPCIFICHSMGGILTKEMLAKALSSASPEHRHNLATATAGLVFFACPHQGSWLADVGWTLRFVGASPAASVLHLRPGKHLEEVNDVIKQLHEERRLSVLSFGEGAATAVMAPLPQLVVVPEASSYPGYGRFVLLEGVDHINACKPLRREDAAYAETLQFILAALENSRVEQRDSEASE